MLILTREEALKFARVMRDSGDFHAVYTMVMVGGGWVVLYCDTPYSEPRYAEKNDFDWFMVADVR